MLLSGWQFKPVPMNAKYSVLLNLSEDISVLQSNWTKGVMVRILNTTLVLSTVGSIWSCMWAKEFLSWGHKEKVGHGNSVLKAGKKDQGTERKVLSDYRAGHSGVLAGGSAHEIACVLFYTLQNLLTLNTGTKLWFFFFGFFFLDFFFLVII